MLLQPVVTLTFEDDPFLVGLTGGIPAAAAPPPCPLEGDLFCLARLFAAAPDLPCKNFLRPVPGL